MKNAYFFLIIFSFSSFLHATPRYVKAGNPNPVPPQFTLTTAPEDTTHKVSHRRINDSFDLQCNPKTKEEFFPLNSRPGYQGKWYELNPRVPRVTYIGVDFIDSLTGWYAGEAGAIIKTTDGGKNWTIAVTPTETILLKVRSYNGRIVIASGFDGLILQSTDGGKNFRQTASAGLKRDIWGLQMLNDTLGWACGMKSALLKTTDGGNNWFEVSANSPANYWGVEFADERTGYIACDSGKILKTSDGGKIWERIQAGDTRALYSLDVFDSNHIAAAGVTGKNVYSADGGKTWTSNPNLIFNSVNCIQFVSQDTGYVIGEEWGIRKTENRGQTWFASNVNIGEWEIKLLTNQRAGYTAGSALQLFKTTNNYDRWKRMFLNDNFNDLHFFDEDHGLVLSKGGLYRTTDGCGTWEQIDGMGGWVMEFTDSIHGYIGTSYVTPYNHSVITIYRSTDGGLTWINTPPTGVVDSAAAILKMYFFNSRIGWVGTVGGDLIKTTDAGLSWRSKLSIPYLFFAGIHFIDSLNGWTANLGKRPFKSTDGGNIWTLQSQINLTLTYDAYFKSNQTGWLIESNGLYKTTNGGTTWTKTPNIDGLLRSFEFFKEPNHWIIAGGNRFETTDNGDTWTNITATSPPLTRLSAPRNGLAFVCGDNGLIYKYIDSTLVAVKDEKNNKQRKLDFSLAQNYPNPFNPVTTIRYEIPKSGHVTLAVYNLLGERIAVLVDEVKDAGAYQVPFDGSKLSSGVYIYKLTAGENVMSRKMTLVK